jgi:hypothetical protein
MAQRRRGQIHVALDLPGGHAACATLNHETQDGEPYRVPQGSQLLSVTVQLRNHALLLIFSKELRKHGFGNLAHEQGAAPHTRSKPMNAKGVPPILPIVTASGSAPLSSERLSKALLAWLVLG